MTPAPARDPGARARSGSLLARTDGIVIVADPTFAALAGAPSAEALTGRSWPSLVSARAQAALDAALGAAAAARRWSGRLELLFADHPVELDITITLASEAEGLVLLRATEVPREPPVVAAAASAAPAAAERAPAEQPASAGSPERRSERLAAIGDLVAGVAHELNNPLTAILWYAQILAGLAGADRELALQTIEQEALDRLATAAHDLLIADARMPGMDGVELYCHVTEP